MSNGATQRITYNCQNSVAFYNPRNSTFDHAVKLLTSDDNVLTGNTESRLSYRVLSDNCQVRIMINANLMQSSVIVPIDCKRQEALVLA